ncbi:hypothetical protein LCGC14_0684540 [marine sediment metagenome]|uniref:Uncharacterized protein n=1 Tax=marine sediment metagenome TaxID=412755 RepID=A0A0F9T8L9_9ZZZZ
MTNKERFERIEKKIINNSNTIQNMRNGCKALVKEWKVYEDEYKKYIAKKNRFRNSLWWLWCKVTFRSTKLTEKELNKRVAKKMAHVFYKGDHR